MSMLQISHDTLHKLTHESEEIRLRTMEQMVNKLDRALALKEKVEVKSVDLCKQLIRWFGFTPIRNAVQVLQLLQRFLQSPEYGDKVIRRLSAERLRKELKKIKKLLDQQTAELKIIHELDEFLKVYELSARAQQNDLDDIEEIISHTKRLELNEDTGDPIAVFNNEDYEVAWSKPSTSDYTSMKLMADILSDSTSTISDLQNALLHLQITMKDYPAEYLLQAPHIFRKLLQVFSGATKGHDTPKDVAAATLLEFLNILEKRLEYRRKSLFFPYSTQIKQLSKNQLPSQMKVSKALRDILPVCLEHIETQTENMNTPFYIWNILFKILRLYNFLEQKLDNYFIQKLLKIVTDLGNHLSDTEQHTKLRLIQMQFIFLLQDIVLSKACYNPTESLFILLKDYPIKCLYPIRFQALQNIPWKIDGNMKEKYQAVESYRNSLQFAVNILNNSQLSAKEVLQKGEDISLILDTIQSKTLLDVLFLKLFEAIPLCVSDPDMRMQSIELVMKMLNVSFKPLKCYSYDKLMSLFKRHLGCLMNGESYVKECSNRSLLEARILGLPLNTTLLLHLVHSSFEDSEEIVQNVCSKIIELLLQSPNLLETNWEHFVGILLPVLPLISCCLSSTKIMELLLKLHNPDSKHLPFISVLQGNVACLYHPQSEKRSEALTRLVYVLNTVNGSEKYMPNLLHISDTLPNDICILKAPREYHHVFSDRSPLRADAVASLNNLFHLLESPDVEPLIRKTTLMQLNVLCSNWHMTAELCNAGACYLILLALENAMQSENCVDYPDSAIPAISILSKILFYDASTRCELSETPNIYILLLRALMMFNHDIQIRQDASMCLFQLVYAHQLIATEIQTEGPIILGNLKMPMNINLRRALSRNDKVMETREKINSVFSTSQEEIQYWRFVIAEASFNGLDSVSHKLSQQQEQLDIREDLKLTSPDVKIIRATQPGVSLKRLVNAASNATDHISLIHVCEMLQQQLFVTTLSNTFTLDGDTSSILANILIKYLQLQPSNSQDLELYEALLDVSITCLNVPVLPLVTGFIKTLHTDIRHAFITILTQKEEMTLFIYLKVSKLLQHLFSQFKDELVASLSPSERSYFVSNLFDMLMERCLQLFEQRDLQRVRCLLSVLLALTDCNLDVPDKLLLYYCRRFFQLSLSLKSFSQTGSNWHRDCLMSILQLRCQMQDNKNTFRLTPGIVKYLSGLCGHTDSQVRILVWSLLYVVSETKKADNKESTNTANECSGAEMLITELSYLPGGFMACCLSTLLDCEEIVWIRQLAGQLFATLVCKQKEIEKLERLLEQHYFVRFAGEALNTDTCVLNEVVPMELNPSNTQITTCELISSFTQICIEMARCSSQFLNDLCTSSFMFKLYEILKHPVTSIVYSRYYYIDMVSDICRLYAMCNDKNLIFLQRTICRDPVWLDSFCKILLTSVGPSGNGPKIIAMLQLLMVLFRDPKSLEYLCTKLVDFSVDMVKLYQYALVVHEYGGSLQKCVLSVLSLFCIKAQPEVGGDDISEKIVKLLDGQHIPTERMKNSQKESEIVDNKENIPKNGKKKKPSRDKTTEKPKNTKSAISEHLCISLIRLFNHLYPVHICKLTTAPTECQQQVVESLALLLKISQTAQQTAQDLKLHEQVFNIFKHFFEEFATMSCTTYVKRYGELKKLTVVRNLQLLFKFLLNWHSSPFMITTDEVIAMEYSKIIIQIWPWLAHSGELKLIVLKVCAFLCERSLIMCKRFSNVNNTAFAHSILQLAVKLTTAETTKLKASSSSDYFHIISFGVRIIINCCSCVEGRNAINKAHVMDIFDCLYPFNPKASRLKPDILNVWLEFWEIFSRYEEGATIHHLNALCSVINRSKGATKLLSLCILRNMTFLNSNRAKLMHSTDFIYTINEVIIQPLNPYPDSLEEQFIVSVAVWQLVSSGVKYAAMIKGTKLAKQLRLLRESVKSSMEEENNAEVKFSKELLKVLDTIFEFFEN